jgi:RNA polymerase sigma-70 factor (ECF subfamily)
VESSEPGAPSEDGSSDSPKHDSPQGEPRQNAASGPSKVTDTEYGSGNCASYASASDAGLARSCAAEELGAYEQLYRQQGARMKNLARNLLGASSDAEDAVQDTFLKVQRSIGSFRGQSSFVTWTFRILVNTCHDMRRRSVRRNEKAQREPSGARDDGGNAMPPEARAASTHPALRLALERAIATLTQHQRDVFLLYEVEGFRHAEIAEMLEITETASKNTLFQAKKSLRQMLDAPRGSQLGGAA